MPVVHSVILAYFTILQLLNSGNILYRCLDYFFLFFFFFHEEKKVAKKKICEK